MIIELQQEQKVLFKDLAPGDAFIPTYKMTCNPCCVKLESEIYDSKFCIERNAVVLATGSLSTINPNSEVFRVLGRLRQVFD